MLNSLLMLGSSYNKNKKVSYLFMMVWAIYMAMNQKMLSLGFSLINVFVFWGVTIAIHLVKNKKLNTVLSVFSILIWSIVIDIICYYLYPLYSHHLSIFGYIWQGILFNYRYVLVNIVAVIIIYGLDCFIDKAMVLCKEKNKIS